MLKLLTLAILLLGAGIAHAQVSASPGPGDGRARLLGELIPEESVYIVQLAEPPALNYQGGTAGMASTRPNDGERFDAANPRVRRYGRYLQGKHDAALQTVGAYQNKLYSYRYAFNGFAARMTAVQAQKLRARRGVLRVWEDRTRYLTTSDSPRFLGLLNSSTGLRAARGLSGNGVIIGVIDSGVAPEHPSFKDREPPQIPRLCRGAFAEETLLGIWLCTKWRRKNDVLIYQKPADWNGTCEAGDTAADKFESTDCNNKLIGARFYIDGFLERQLLDVNEFISPRDADGHGTHIATTAAGNGVQAVIAGQSVARVTGIAPRARIAVYKACWLEPGQTRGSCSTADLQRAIEDAVADGVDIINYSVGSSDLSISDPDDLALLTASNAGVLSVVAAGNDGYDCKADDPPEVCVEDGSILSPGATPWVLSVGMSSRGGTKYERGMRINRPTGIEGNIVIREATFTEPLKSTGTIEGELVLVNDDIAAIDSDGVGTTYDACEDLANGSAISGKIAFLQRGRCTFEEKLINVENAGAVAAVVFNNEGGLIDMAGTRDSVNIPAVMIKQADGERIRTRLVDDVSVEVTLRSNLVINETARGNILASESSRGPNRAAPDILKPDVIAPGVEILAGQTPDVANGIRGERFQYLTGTSMSVPHVAGLAALLKQRHPDWSPAALRSALMTTARQDVTLEAEDELVTAFDIGAGHVEPNRALDPGLVYDAGKEDYDAFNCGSGVPRVSPAECAALLNAGYSLDPSDLNLPSIAVAELPGQRRIQRRVTNIGDTMARFEATVDAPDGIDVSVNPSVLDLGPGETAAFEVELTSNGAPLDEWVFGSLTWSDGQRQVRSPMAVRATNFAAPEAVAGTGSDGSTNFTVEFGYTGTYEARVTGLVSPVPESSCIGISCPAVAFRGTVSDDPIDNYVFQEFDAQLSGSVDRIRFTLDPSVVFLRVALFNDETEGDDDLDLYLYQPAGQDEFGNNLYDAYGPSTNPDSNEIVEIEYPFPGDYFVDVHGFDTDPANGNGTDFRLSVWGLVSGEAAGNLTVTAPDAADAGTTGAISVQWQGLGSGRYLGGIEHRDDTNVLPPFTSIDVAVPQP